MITLEVNNSNSHKENHISNFSFDNFETWFVKTKNLYNNILISDFTNYEYGFSVLNKKYSELLIERDLKNQTEAWDFSLFDIITVRRPEENLHSPLIAELLNPSGFHGQQDLFYKLFLNEVIGEEKAKKFINPSFKEYLTISEEYVKNDIDRGEVDITIKSVNCQNRFAIIIENKWDSGDSCTDQLFKYYTNFTNPYGKAYTDDNLLVLYLTKYGKNPTKVERKEFETFLSKNIGINYFPISYFKNIRNWLEQCISHCESQKVRIIIEQYLNHIKHGINNRR